MGESLKSPPLYYLASFLFILYISVLVESNGLTMRLIHPGSIDHPFFQSNLSDEERIRRLVSQTNTNATYLTKPSSAVVQPIIDKQSYLYIVKIGLGTFKTKPPYKQYYLEMDTSSTISWIECQGCTICFNQAPDRFPKDSSSSFRPILRENNRIAHYYLSYADGTSTHGILATETLSLRSNTGAVTKVEKFQFGCGLNNKMQYGAYGNNKIAGILGLGWGHMSIQNQIFPQSKGKFSYCLPSFSRKNAITYLRFGNDVIQPQNPKSTPLYRANEDSDYFVKVIGISLNNIRLNISSNVFALRNNGSSGGFAFDSGTPYSRIIKPAYDVLISELEKYFTRLKNLKRIDRNLGLELCYRRKKPEGYNNLPDVTFHLEGSNADFVMKAEAVFEVVVESRPFWKREYFCMPILEGDKQSIIGSYQQTNQRIIFDTENKQLLFQPEDCSKTP